MIALLPGIIGTSIGLVLAKQAADREKLAAEKLLEASEKERQHEIQEVLAPGKKKHDDERAEITVANSLKQAMDMRRQYHFKQARAMLTQAKGVLGPAGNPGLSQQVDIALEQLDFIEELDRIRQEKALIVGANFDWAAASPRYATAFVNHGLDVFHGDEAALALP